MRRVLFVDRDGTLVAERKSLAEPVESGEAVATEGEP